MQLDICSFALTEASSFEAREPSPQPSAIVVFCEKPPRCEAPQAARQPEVWGFVHI